jgi:hypothetical protein
VVVEAVRVVELRFRYLRSPARCQGLLPQPQQLSMAGLGFAFGFGELPSGAALVSRRARVGLGRRRK